MSVLVNAVNGRGTPVTAMTCRSCGHEFTVCPPVDPDQWGNDCLGDNCPSYDLSRDVDTFFPALADAGLIEKVDR